MCSISVLDDKEQLWIDLCGIENLYNICPLARSRRGMKMPQSAIEKIRAANIGKKRSPDVIAKIRAATHPMSEETKRKIGAAWKGRIHTDETKEKMRASHLGREFSAEHRANISARRKGIIFTDEHKSNISKASKAAWTHRKAASND
jgi:hypothetical protein